ncbi:MAG: tetratricopeptide repeat protein [Holophagales bacterium]|nr:tetratricopeptide repeat protein [Holophagales bacterium]MYF97407.1 tetratricopeptide repeat protein [Holophagales bacterium]
MSRLTRDEIRRDEVREAVFSASTWFAEHVRQILMGVAAVIAAVVGVVLFLNYQDGREKEASYQLSEALKTYRAPIDAPATDAIDDLFGTPPDSAPDEGAAETEAPTTGSEGGDDGLSFASEAERRSAARTELEAVRASFGSTSSGRLASVYLGQIAAADGDTATARELWTGYLEAAGRDHAMAIGVQLNLYSLDRAEGRGEELAATLRGAVAAESSPLPKDALLFELAATLAQLGDEEGARETFQRVVNEFPDSGYAIRARQQLGPEAAAASPFTFGG